MALRDLFAQLTVQVDTVQLQQAHAQLDQTAVHVGNAGRSTMAAEGHVNRLLHSFERLGAALQAFVVVEAARKLHAFIDEQIEGAKQVKIMSERLSVSTRDFQAWSEVLKINGADASGLQQAFRVLSKSMAGTTEEGSKADALFDKLGLNIRELKDAPPIEAFEKVGKALAGMTNEQERTAVGSKLLGRSYLTLKPVFSQGTKALEEQIAEMRELG